MKEVPLIHTSWLKPFADYFAGQQVDLSHYYASAGIQPRQVTSGDDWITKVQLYNFLNALAVGEKMPEVGFVVGETITPDALGSMGEAMAQATTIASKSGKALRLAKWSLNGIEVLDPKDSYRFEQGFTFELYSMEDSQEARDAFVEKRDAKY